MSRAKQHNNDAGTADNSAKANAAIANTDAGKAMEKTRFSVEKEGECWRIKDATTGKFVAINPFKKFHEARDKACDMNQRSLNKPVRKTTQHLRIKFSGAEIEHKAQQLAQHCQDLGRIDSEQKSANKQFTARKAAAQSQIDLLTEEISSGHRTGMVDCEWRLNTPVDGQKTLVRLDNQQTERIEGMTDADRQGVFEDILGTVEKTVEQKGVGEIDPDQVDETDVEHGDGSNDE